MIRQNELISEVDNTQDGVDPHIIALVRYGRVPQVARFGVSLSVAHECDDNLTRGAEVVVDTDRGPEIGIVLELLRTSPEQTDIPITGPLHRIASPNDLALHQSNARQSDLSFFDWQQRVKDWQLQLQLVDVETTLDPDKVILYVLNGQNAETTRLALLAAAAGFGVIHVQPVAKEGIVQQTSGGGCGSGGCGSGGCS